jgi:hypothetical protein
MRRNHRRHLQAQYPLENPGALSSVRVRSSMLLEGKDEEDQEGGSMEKRVFTMG